MKHHLITATFLTAALVCYVLGLRPGMIALLVIGLVFECVFWRGRARMT